MSLNKYENKLIRIIDTHNNIFEGIGIHNSKDYNESEYGRAEESIQILYFNFYQDGIKSIEEIENFSEEYGLIEEMIIEDGISFIEDIWEDEYEEEIIRILKCIDKKLDTILYKKKLIEYLKRKLKKNVSKDIERLIQKIINRKEELYINKK